MVKLLKKAYQSQDGPEMRLLPPNSQVVKQRNVLKGNQSEHTKGKIAKQPYCWYGESFDGLEERSQHCLRPKPNPEQGPSSFQVYEGWRRWGNYRKKSWKLVEVGSWVLRKEAIFVTQSAEWKRESWCRSCSNLSRRSNKIISEDGDPKLELSSVEKRVFYWRRCPRGLAWLARRTQCLASKIQRLGWLSY